MAHSCSQSLNLSTQLKNFNSNRTILTKRGLGRVSECSAEEWTYGSSSNPYKWGGGGKIPLQEKLAVTTWNVRNFRTNVRNFRTSRKLAVGAKCPELPDLVRNFHKMSETSAAGKNSPAHQLKNIITFSSGLRFRWIWTFRKAYSEGYPTQLKTRSKSIMCKCCDKCFSQVSTWVS